jgi:hypothetical protein
MSRARRARSVVAIVVGMNLPVYLSGCGGEETPRRAAPEQGTIVTVVEKVGLRSIGSMRVGPDGHIYVGGSSGVLAYPARGVERVVYSPPHDSARIDGLAFANGFVYVLDTREFMVREVKANGGYVNLVGTGSPGIPANGGPATSSALACPSSLAFDAGAGDLLIRDGYQIRRVDSAKLIHSVFTPREPETVEQQCTSEVTGIRVARNGDYIFGGVGSVGRIGRRVEQAVFYPAPGDSSVTLEGPVDIAYDADSDTIYVAEKTRIKRIAADGRISTIAGTGASKVSGDGGPPLAAGLGEVAAIDLDKDGNLYIATGYPPRIRVIGAPFEGQAP